jgi:hypothetical protein
LHLALLQDREYVLGDTLNHVEKKWPLPHEWRWSCGGMYRGTQIRFEVLMLQKSITLAKGIVRDNIGCEATVCCGYF